MRRPSSLVCERGETRGIAEDGPSEAKGQSSIDGGSEMQEQTLAEHHLLR